MILLQAEKLGKSFTSGTREIRVLNQLDLRVESGQSVSIQGESGSGKTTLLNLLAGLEMPDQGSVFWEGKALPKKQLSSIGQWRGHFMGMIFQHFYLVPELNALENVCFAARIMGKFSNETVLKASALLERVGLGERLESMPQQLSGGERQRVAMARALINDPHLMLADEPTGNLDETSANIVMQLLLELCQEEGKALLLVTHSPTYARECASVLNLHGGKLEKGTT